MPQPTQEYFDAKETLRKATTEFAEAKSIYESAKLEHDSLLADIEEQISVQKQTLADAKSASKLAEEKRKDLATQLKATPKNTPQYDDLKAQLEQAKIAKQSTEDIKNQAEQEYQNALQPFQARLRLSSAFKGLKQDALEQKRNDFKSAQKEFMDICQRCFAQSDAHELFDAEMTDLAEEIMRIRKQVNLLEAWEEVGTTILRTFVNQNPTGLTKNDLTEEKSYPLWINLAQTHMAILEESPRYVITFDDLASLIGIDNALAYIESVPHSKVEPDVKRSQLINKKTGQPLTLEELDEITETKFTTPKLKLSHLGTLKKEDIAIVITPQFLQLSIDSLQNWENENKILPGTTSALQKAGVTTIGQLAQMGFQRISKTPGIGPKRAQALFKALKKL